MNRRHAIFAIGAGALFAGPAFGQLQQPYKISLIAGGKVESLWKAGILVELEADWKTYWRMPGDAGIPPHFDWTGSTNVDSVTVSFPVPTRFQDASGEAIGYHNQVMFPISVTPLSANMPVRLKLNMFFAVCKGICIPAKADLQADLKSSGSNQQLALWQQRVPVLVTGENAPAVTNARFEMLDGAAFLAVQLAKAGVDIFVEADVQAYFGKPRFDIKPNEAWLPLASIKTIESLKKQPLKLTVSYGDTGIEQTIMVN
jgi:DsbC/DsbD-like thiol-disulfide interchange protein